ncbi:Crp/Fnr family transcriptional regulator [Gaetbulibacter aquiaggeris]|uniref:Crp/Fnr family transcriptional regulator n=1 Tax=Gaetbulibacter aquiaggeris TaxID=1735373 RepID=A0ABW7MR85_9FLAO
MFTEYLNILSKYSPLSENTKSQLEPYISIKNLSKEELLLKHGDVCRHIYYVNKGFIRIFYFKDGKEVTEWLTNDKHFFFSITSYFESSPSHLIIEAIEDSEIIQLSKVGLDKLRKVNLEIANLMIEWISRSLVLSQKRMDSIQFETAKQRYDSLLKMQPEILNRVPLQHIASFLGITQETLSRIRSKK